MRLHVEVTQEDIDKGCRNDAFGKEGGCMVWRAIMRATEGGLHRLGINSGGGTYFLTPNSFVCFDFPWWVGPLVIDFDEGRAVAPFSFDFELPTQARS